ncbi:MAG: hypothetical protein LBR32_06825 [Propionibacteriaceae bacterium]|jgi:hypothetical protein|nr:hypothetical protein [Propionibacteriaceae bacterium]
MTLVISAAAAVAVAVWRFAKPETGRRLALGVLALMYAGAALMWCADGFASLVHGGPFLDFSAPAVADDALLGLCVLALGLAVWGVYLMAHRHRPSRA